MKSLGDLNEAELAEIWLREAERRAHEMDSGKVEGIPGEAVFAGIRARYAN